MINYKDIKLDNDTINDIVRWVSPEENFVDKKIASCQSLFPLINIFQCETVVELGTYWGCATSSLLENCPSIQKLYTIDKYLSYKDTVKPFIEVSESGANFLKLVARRNFSYLPKNLQEKINIIYGDTIESVKRFEDKSVDFMWFDAHLSEEQLANELESWYPKVSHGGIVGVHDCGNNGSHMDQVVYEFMEGKSTEGCMSYFNDTLSWIKVDD
jgi:predicted O-methyltransferase YrrM